MAHTGHRRRAAKHAIAAIVDLMFLQASTSTSVKARSRALLSLLLRQTSDIRKEQEEYERLHVRPDDPEMAAVQKALGIEAPPSLVPGEDLESGYEMGDPKITKEMVGHLESLTVAFTPRP
jgi:hypothetical protein